MRTSPVSFARPQFSAIRFGPQQAIPHTAILSEECDVNEFIAEARGWARTNNYGTADFCIINPPPGLRSMTIKMTEDVADEFQWEYKYDGRVVQLFENRTP